MTDAPTLFGTPVVRDAPPGEHPKTIMPHAYADGLLGHESTDTSRAAAEEAVRTAGRDAARVLTAIASSAEGLTDDEGERILGLRHTTYSARRRGLVLDGLVVDSTERRPTSAGRPAIVWKAGSRSEA